MNPETVSLAYRQGKSDKVYHVHLRARQAGWVVETQHGRRGGNMTAGAKTAAPVPYGQAKQIFDQTVSQKRKDGYTNHESGVPFTGAEDGKQRTGHLPQLLTPITDAEACLRDPALWAQEKFDGERVMAKKSGDRVQGINRKGETRQLPVPLVQALQGLDGDFIVDGELVGDHAYHAFDLPSADAPYSERLQALTKLWRGLPGLAFTAKTEAAKRQLLADIEARHAEGLVFKRHAARYSPGERNRDQFKHKLWESATCKVLSQSPGKRSVEVGVKDGATMRSVGFVTIPSNHEIPAVGAIVEVRYLYAYPGGSLFESSYLGERRDMTEANCTAAQLKLKPEALA